jgi:purine-nucleoside phosphorylase
MAKYLGCHSAVITNAAGGLNPAFAAGDLMVIDDHINLIGANPLRGPNPPELQGPRFLDLSAPYDEGYQKVVHECAAELGLPALRTGVYIGVSGPTYETRAEVRLFRVSLGGWCFVGGWEWPEIGRGEGDAASGNEVLWQTWRPVSTSFRRALTAH